MTDIEKQSAKPEVVTSGGKNSAKLSKKKPKPLPRVKKGPAATRPYPRVPLERALNVARALKEKNGGNPWRATEVAKFVGLSPTNVDFYYLLLASQKFGLTTGTKSDGDVSLTPLGRQLVYSGSPEEELNAKRQALLNVEVFKNVLQHYNGNRLPEMQYLGNTLQDKFGLPSEFHEEFSRLFKQNCEYVGWTEGLELDKSTPGPSGEIPGHPKRSSSSVNRKLKLA